MFKALLLYAFKERMYYKVGVAKVSSEQSAKDMQVQLRAFTGKVSEPTRKYNISGIKTHSPKENQMIIMTYDTEAIIDVQSLAYAFNLSLAEMKARIITIAEMPKGMEAVEAILIDTDFWQVYNAMLQMKDIDNPKGLYRNYFLHFWNVYSVSKMVTAVAFVTDLVGITTLTVAPSQAYTSFDVGETYTFKLTANGNQVPSVEWDITGNSSNLTQILNGVLFISPKETATALTITATSTDNETIKGTYALKMGPVTPTTEE